MRATITIIVLLLAGAVTAQTPLDQHGESHQWKGASDRYTIVDFAASWCRPCWKVLPRMQDLASSHPDIRVIVVSVDDEISGRDALVDRLGLTVPVVWDAGHEIAEHYRPGGMPATFVLDPEGNIVYSHVGSSDTDWKALLSFIESVKIYKSSP